MVQIWYPIFFAKIHWILLDILLKNYNCSFLYFFCGEDRIRTCVNLRSTRFPSVRLKPLGHPSNFEAKLIVRPYYIKQMNSIYLLSLAIQLSCKIIETVPTQLANSNPAFLLRFWAIVKTSWHFIIFLCLTIWSQLTSILIEHC